MLSGIVTHRLALSWVNKFYAINLWLVSEKEVIRSQLGYSKSLDMHTIITTHVDMWYL